MADESVDEQFERLQFCLSKRDEKGLLDVLFDLGAIRSDRAKIADEVVERLLTLLTNEEMYESPFAGHALMFFEFHSASLTDGQKWLCIGFLNAHGNEVTEGFSSRLSESFVKALI